MQDYLREQTYNAKSYNMIVTTTDYASEFLTHLQYPVALDIFVRTLSALHEFVQGPNFANQEILIQHNFIEVANAILKFDYRDDEEIVRSSKRDEVGMLSKQLSLVQSIHSIKAKSHGNSGGKSKFDISNDDITLPINNFMISLVKYKCLLVLSQLLEGRSPTSYVYYSFRRILDPMVFRQNFAYQSYFMRKFHRNEYTSSMFFKYNSDIDRTFDSPLIIEVGFILYFLLMKMQRNLYQDMDEKYYKRLICLLSEKEKAASTTHKNLFLMIIDFIIDLWRLCTRCCRKHTGVISLDKIYIIQKSDRKMRSILGFYAKNVSQVEIFKDGVPQRQYFPILPFCQFSSETPKEKFKASAVRTNAKTKCESLMKESKYLITDLKVNYWLRTGLTRFIGLFQIYLDMIQRILVYVALGLNIMILFAFSNEEGERIHDPSLGDSSINFTKKLLLSIGCVAIFLIFLIFANSLINKIPIKIKRYQTRQKERVKRMKESGRLLENARVQLGALEPIYDICSDATLLYYLALMVLTILGVAWHPFFYTFLLTYTVFRSLALRNVLQAIWLPREALVLTFALMLMVIYAFTVISFYYYAEDYSTNDCYSLLSCFVISFDNTFKNDGGLGGYLSSAYTQNANSVDIKEGRVIFDNLAFLLVGILLIEIISGIIIDTFAELRQKNDEIQEDAKTYCFVCDKTRDELEKMYGANGFDYHINQHHNLWDYLFFIAYLETKQENENNILDTSERYVIEKIDKEDHSWMPCYA